MHLQPWWLDALCLAENWDVALAFDGAGGVLGALPWHKKRRWGLWVIQNPPISAYAGPWLRYPEAPSLKLQSRYSFEKKVCNALIHQLPRTIFFLQNFRPEVENWLPFYWHGFRQSTRYTYVFDHPIALDDITTGMKNTLRSDLKKAAQGVEYRLENNAWNTVLQLNTQSFERKKLRQPYDESTFERLHIALAGRQQMACFIARDRISDAPHAGLYLAFDTQQAAVLLSGAATAYKSSCAVYGLFLEAIKFCSERGLSLDFEGSMSPAVEHTFRAFGARQQAYSQVWKARSKFWELLFHLSRR